MKIAKIHQRVGDGVLIPFRALDSEYFPIAGFREIQVARKGADVTKITERIGEGAIILGQAIIRDCLFIGCSGLRQLAAMEKDARAMFMIIRHEVALVRRREVCYVARRWLTRTANAAAANTSTIVAMGRFVCPVRIVGTMNPILSPQPSAKSALLLTIPNPALRTLQLSTV